MRTPGGHKVRPIFESTQGSLFKPVTPFVTLAGTKRAGLRHTKKKDVLVDLPQMVDYQRAETVQFTATLDAITNRVGKKRRRDLSIGNTSAAEVFRAYGIEVRFEQQKSHHWSHLIAHFLCGADQLISEQEEVTNLVPSTAVANYNTLKMIEVFIKDQLVNKKTERITIVVEPHYTDELLIPNLLTYTLSWMDTATKSLQLNRYQINPQSYERINRCMLESIDVLRTRTTVSDPEKNNDEEDNSLSSLNTSYP